VRAFQHSDPKKQGPLSGACTRQPKLIHPFREGNGRCARVLSTLMALQAGLPPLDFGCMEGRGKRRYIAAIHAALGRDYAPMEDIFRVLIARTRSAAP